MAPTAPDRVIRVLVVDDHSDVRTFIANALTQDARLEVIGEAGNGLEAIDALERRSVDVVVMDVNMPRMNGIQATREISWRWPGVSVVGQSAYTGEHAAVQMMLDAGAHGFVAKDEGIDRLIAAILARALLSQDRIRGP